MKIVSALYDRNVGILTELGFELVRGFWIHPKSSVRVSDSRLESFRDLRGLLTQIGRARL